MLKKLFFIVLCLPNFGLLAQNSGITHTVKSGETITQIANYYNIKVKDIYAYNQLDKNGYIRVGQKLMIPPSTKNQAKKETTTKHTNKNSGNYHIIEPGETLYKISKDYNISIQQIRDWNNLENDNIKLGDTLFIAKQKKNSQLVNPNNDNQEAVAVKSHRKESKDSHNLSKVNDYVVENKMEKNISSRKSDSKNTNSEIGVFEKQFTQANKSVIGLCGTFKTISGWKDKKYYALMNDAVNGSVVKVKVDDKVIYAKVLGPLPNIKDDSSLMIRISNAAAAALGVNYDLFEVKVEQP